MFNRLKLNLINFYSSLLAKRFCKQWNADSLTNVMKSGKTLQRYRSVRRLLPVMMDGNHWGNHWCSDKKAYNATQGF